jgi:Spy/CpxP family protein refolding chaperone
MKRTLLALVILTLFVTGVSYGVANWCVRQPASGPIVDLNDATWLKRELKLTDTQSTQIEKLGDEFRAEVERCCETHCGARFALSEELAKPQVDLAKVNADVDRMSTAESESEKATLNHILRVRALLMPDQQQQYAKLVSQQVCTACPLGLHHAMP